MKHTVQQSAKDTLKITMLRSSHSLKEKEISSSIVGIGQECILSENSSKAQLKAVNSYIFRLKCPNCCTRMWTVNIVVQSHGPRLCQQKIQICGAGFVKCSQKKDQKDKKLQENHPTIRETFPLASCDMYSYNKLEHTHLLTLGDKYVLTACDLSDVSQFQKIMDEHKLDPKIPTFFYAECVLSYIDSDKVD